MANVMKRAGLLGDISWPSGRSSATASANVLIHRRPALRVDDLGLGDWKAVEGAPYVLINRRRAHRQGDKHSSSELRGRAHPVNVAIGDAALQGGAPLTGPVEVFNVRVSLDTSGERVRGGHGHADASSGPKLPPANAKYIFTPLGIPDGKDRRGNDRVHFMITIESTAASFRADSITIRILFDQKSIYEEAHDSKSDYAVVGEHEWTWDGFDKQGILDTSRLRKGITLQVVASKNGVVRTDAVAVEARPWKHRDWVDARIDRSRRSIAVIARVQPRDGGIVGTPGPTTPSYEQLKRLLFQGVAQYWSQPADIDGVRYQISVKADESPAQSINYPPLVISTGRWFRSMNPNPRTGPGIAIVSALGVKARVVYNLQDSNGSQVPWPDKEFMLIAAHEFGHPVLLLNRDQQWSWNHKGTAVSYNSISSAAPDAAVLTGPLDLMKYYYNDPSENTPDRYTRYKAVEEDVRALVWLARCWLRRGRAPALEQPVEE